MARKLTDIYDALALEKSTQQQLTGLAPAVDSAQQLLGDLDSPSKVARWRLFLWVVATAIWAHEVLWDLFRAEVDAIVASAHIGTARWYVRKALEFQLGYALVNVDGVFQYPTIVPAAQIVKRAAIREAGGLIILKVAKEVSGVVTPLDVAEMTSFTAYVNDIRMAGVMVNIVSDVPDLLHIGFDVYYDPLLLTPNGALITSPSTFPVEDAINAYISSLPFDGTLVLTHLVDAVQAAVGVVNPVLVAAEAHWGAFPLAPINVSYNSHAGHAAIDPAYPLSSTITYIPA